MHAFDFYIVGVGSSAGGIPPLKQLVSHLPENLNAAVVLIPHLHPQHRSQLNHILSRCSKLPVTRVEESIPVKPGVIYVLAENKIMTLEEGCLRIRDRAPEEKINYAIDVFFESLAKEAGAKAIGVVLSGTNDDGSKGSIAITNAGGMVMAQDPETAIHPRMPRETIKRDDPKIIAELQVLVNAIVNRVRNTDKAETS